MFTRGTVGINLLGNMERLYPNNTREVILAGADSGAESDGMPRTVCECPLLPASEEASAAV